VDTRIVEGYPTVRAEFEGDHGARDLGHDDGHPAREAAVGY